MIVWGSKGEVEVLKADEHKHCQVCEKERTFMVQLHYKVNHIWYLFKWVTGKQYVKVCEVCQRGEKLVTKEVEDKLGKPAIPFMHRWGWAFLIALIVGFVVFADIETSKLQKEEQAMIASPMQRDIYVVDLASVVEKPGASVMYGVLRIKNIDGNNIEFDAPRVTYNKPKGAMKDIAGGEVIGSEYYDGTIVFSKEELTQLQKDGHIYSIERN